MTHLVVMMGVAGSGKTTVGQLLAESLGSDFIDGDALHPEPNIDKMRTGTPLDDSDREPWLRRIGVELGRAAGVKKSLVIGCSALKRSYRDLIREDAPRAVFVHLHGSRQLLEQRMQDRPGHFMPLSLLESQLSTLEMLEPDEAGQLVDISEDLSGIVEASHSWLTAPC